MIDIDQVSKSKADAIMFIEDAEEKFALFYAHCVRVVNQSTYIDKTKKELFKRCTDLADNLDTIHCIGDFKMKLEDLSSQTTSAEHYGKCGMSWHGFHIAMWIFLEGKAVEALLYLDQIMEGDSKQDWAAIASVVKLLIVQVKSQFSWIK